MTRITTREAPKPARALVVRVTPLEEPVTGLDAWADLMIAFAARDVSAPRVQLQPAG